MPISQTQHLGLVHLKKVVFSLKQLNSGVKTFTFSPQTNSFSFSFKFCLEKKTLSAFKKTQRPITSLPLPTLHVGPKPREVGPKEKHSKNCLTEKGQHFLWWLRCRNKKILWTRKAPLPPPRSLCGPTFDPLRSHIVVVCHKKTKIRGKNSRPSTSPPPRHKHWCLP